MPYMNDILSQKLNLTKNMTRLLKEKLLYMYGINSKLGQFFFLKPSFIIHMVS